MADLGITPPSPLCLSASTSDQQQTWTLWRDNLQCYFTAICVQSSKRRRALLLYLAGEELRRIHSTLEDTEDSFETTLGLLNTYFESKINLTYERNRFRSLTPEGGESTLHFITRLKHQALKCNFDEYTSDDAICDQYIEKCHDGRLRRKLLTDPKLSIDRLINLSSTNELVEQYASSIENNQSEELNIMQKRFQPNKKFNYQSTNHNYSSSFTKQNNDPKHSTYTIVKQTQLHYPKPTYQ